MLFPPRGADLRYATELDWLSFLIAYLRLFNAYEEAQDLGCAPRSRPVPLSGLRESKIEDYILLWMLYQGHIEPILPSPCPLRRGPGESVGMSLLLSPGSSLALTELGSAFVGDLFSDALVPGSDRIMTDLWSKLRMGLLVPYFDQKEHVFGWGRHLLKQFYQPAGNQQLVLCAEEELNWPRWLDDPLLRRPGVRAKVRLHDTIKYLNLHQKEPLIRFTGDGTGTRIGWRYW